MTHYSNITRQLWLDFEAVADETINLSALTIQDAVKLSEPILNPQRQWQTYLNSLAFFGFEQWLNQRSSELILHREQCSLFQPSLANEIEAVCNLIINGFKLCLIVNGSLIDEQLSVPRSVIDLPEFMHHFYVLIEVQEEQETVVVRGFISYEQLINQRRQMLENAAEDWTYLIPWTWFDGTPDHLLLELRCLNPNSISLPALPNHRSTQLDQMRADLVRLLPQLKFPDSPLWEILTWEQATVVLTSPDLLNWLYQLRTDDSSLSRDHLTHHLSDLLQLLTQKAVNVGRWLSDELDELAQEVSWQLLPNLAPATALRAPTEEFEAIINELQHYNVDIPPQARGAYRNLRLAGIPLRLYALTWPLLSESIPEWTLLLILGVPSHTSFPASFGLRISDQKGILVEQVLDINDNYPYFFTSVVGTWDEKFIATISFGSGIEETLPPFSFELD